MQNVVAVVAVFLVFPTPQLMEWEFLSDCAISWSLPTCTFFIPLFTEDFLLYGLAYYDIQVVIMLYLTSLCLGFVIKV